jgi:hypothetical protein
MGIFSQRKEPSTWAALPGEPLEREGSVDSLPEVVGDPLNIGLGGGTTFTQIEVSIPVIVPDDDA